MLGAQNKKSRCNRNGFFHGRFDFAPGLRRDSNPGALAPAGITPSHSISKASVSL